MWGGCSKQ
uniref:Uncharacterized protein n=1 Tax=Arundo donax TaxID=35708 RepID=A0A0A9ETJ0_ARUDO